MYVTVTVTVDAIFGYQQIAVILCFHDTQWWSDLERVFLFVSVVESAAGVVASAKTGAEMIEDSSKYMILTASRI